MTADARVGLVGLGAMGRPIARLLGEAGVPTSCLDTDPDAVADVARYGVTGTASLADLGASCDVLLILVPSDEDVLQVCSPHDGVLARARAGTVLLVCSSVRPDTCERVARLAGERGVLVLDAALTGGVRAAEAGRINLLVGGDTEVLERVRPALSAWTSTVHHLGALGAGQIGKTVNNLCHWGQLSAIVEALRLGRALGLDPSALRAAVLDGPAASRTLAEMHLMRLTWHAKDLANAQVMAAAVGVELPVTTTVTEAMTHISVEDIAQLCDPPTA